MPLNCCINGAINVCAYDCGTMSEMKGNAPAPKRRRRLSATQKSERNRAAESRLDGITSDEICCCYCESLSLNHPATRECTGKTAGFTALRKATRYKNWESGCCSCCTCESCEKRLQFHRDQQRDNDIRSEQNFIDDDFGEEEMTQQRDNSVVVEETVTKNIERQYIAACLSSDITCVHGPMEYRLPVLVHVPSCFGRDTSSGDVACVISARCITTSYPTVSGEFAIHPFMIASVVGNMVQFSDRIEEEAVYVCNCR